MQRVLAVLAAVGMVVAAVMVRGAMDDKDGNGDDGGDGGAAVVVCATDVGDACGALGSSVEVRMEDPAITAAAFAEGSVAEDVDAWITSTAWLEVTESRAPDALGEARAIATSPATVATAPGRHEAISELCAGDDIWQCLGASAGADWADLGDGSHPEWRELKVGLTDPDLALGLPVLASAAAGYFEGTDFATNDLELTEFDAWLADLADPSASGDADPARTLATRPGTYSAAGAVGAVADRLDEQGVQTIEPDVSVAATIAIVEVEGGDELPSTDGVREALEDEGWAGADGDDLTPTLKPGVMAALHSLWRTVTT